MHLDFWAGIRGVASLTSVFGSLPSTNMINELLRGWLGVHNIKSVETLRMLYLRRRYRRVGPQCLVNNVFARLRVEGGIESDQLINKQIQP